MNQTDLGAAIEAAKGEATEVKNVKVDIFDIPETKAETTHITKSINIITQEGKYLSFIKLLIRLSIFWYNLFIFF